MAFKWGIIGPGNIAHEFTDDLKHVKDDEHIVQAVVAKDIESAREFATQENVAEYYDSVQSFFAKSHVMIVCSRSLPNLMLMLYMLQHRIHYIMNRQLSA
jgi:predicted dehydrogenase